MRLRTAITRISRELAASGGYGGLTSSQASVLSAIARWSRPLAISEVAELEAIDAPSLSRILRVLAERGFIRRTQDPSDLRVGLVEASAKGRKIYLRIRENRQRAIRVGLAHLDPEEAEAVVAAVDGLEELANVLIRSRTSVAYPRVQPADGRAKT